MFGTFLANSRNPLKANYAEDVLCEVRRTPLPRTPVNRGKGLYKKYDASMTNGRERGSDRQMAESQLSELQNMRVHLEEARGLSRNLAYHRRARLEAKLGDALDEVDRQIVELRADRGSWRSSTHFGGEGHKEGPN
jgi:hypothetical protein